MIYMPAANLRKTQDMDTGAVGHWREDCVRKFVVKSRDPQTLKRLEKTRREVFPDLAAERAAFDSAARGEKQAGEQRRREEERLEKDERRRMEDLKSYKSLQGLGADEGGALTNAELGAKYSSAQEYEDDFM
jgi:hypothetical protein